MTSLDGEYMVLGRKTLDTANIFVQYGQGATRTVNVTGGSGVQEAEFVDGLRFSVMSGMPFKMNVDIPHGVDQTVLPGGSISLSESYFYFALSTKGRCCDACQRTSTWVQTVFTSSSVMQVSDMLTQTDSFAWTVNTTTPVGNTLATTAKFPCKSSHLISALMDV